MRDYALMVKILRSCAENSCEGCPIGGAEYTSKDCRKVHNDAADAIEELLARDVVPADFHERCLQLEIKKRIELEKQMPHWISVKERLPEIREIVLAYVDELGLIIRAKIVDAKDYRGERRIDWARVDPDPFFLSCYTITHWMPLPAPPKGVE